MTTAGAGAGPRDLLTILVPMLSNRARKAFNVFDVMHHGTHEKQLSNVFAWLFDAEGFEQWAGRPRAFRRPR